MKKNNLYISNQSTAFGLCFCLLLFIACCTSKPNAQDHNEKQSTGKDSITGTDKNSEMTDHKQMDALKDKSKGGEVIKMKQGKDSTDEIYWNTLSSNQTVISKQAAVQVGDSRQQFTINGNGYVTFDLRRNRKISLRIGGRIERLYVKYNYQYVRKGEKIMELYSPELNTYVSEYLFIKRESMDTVLMATAKQKLVLLGLTRNQILKIDQSGVAPFAITIYSPFEGFVLFNPLATGVGMSVQSAPGGDGMDNPAAGASTEIPGTTLPDNSIREGMYVSKDQAVFWINDFKEVWGIVAFPHENEKILKPGVNVTVKSELFPDQTFRTVIPMVEPIYTSGQKFTQVRLYLSNSRRRLKQNSLITATVSVDSQAILVPASSVYYLGNTAIVWVRKAVTKQGSNIFLARAVKTGNRNNQNIEVLKGLNRGEFIAKDAGYLADSETIIQY